MIGVSRREKSAWDRHPRALYGSLFNHLSGARTV